MIQLFVPIPFSITHFRTFTCAACYVAFTSSNDLTAKCKARGWVIRAIPFHPVIFTTHQSTISRSDHLCDHCAISQSVVHASGKMRAQRAEESVVKSTYHCCFILEFVNDAFLSGRRNEEADALAYLVILCNYAAMPAAAQAKATFGTRWKGNWYSQFTITILTQSSNYNQLQSA